MRQFIKNLPRGAEFVVVIGVAFGRPILGSIVSALHPSAAPHHTAGSLLALTLSEAAVIAALGMFLALRGWTFKDLGLKSNPWDAVVGLGLLVAHYVAWLLIWDVTVAVSPQTTQAMTDAHVVAQGIPIFVAAIVSLVNPIFEEVFVCGYVVAALKRDDSPWLAVNVSVALRLAYHLYQGPLGVLGIIPFGLISAYWFARTGRLWPSIVMHVLGDALAFASVAV